MKSIPLCAAAIILSWSAQAAAADTPPKPVACAYDQFSETERTVMGRAALSAMLLQAENDSALDDVDKKVVAKIETCPGFKSMKDDQLSFAKDYAEGRILLDAVNFKLGADISGEPLVSVFWAQIPESARKQLRDAASDPAGSDKGLDQALDKAAESFGPVLTRFASRHAMGREEIMALLTGAFAMGAVEGTEARW